MRRFLWIALVLSVFAGIYGYRAVTNTNRCGNDLFSDNEESNQYTLLRSTDDGGRGCSHSQDQDIASLFHSSTALTQKDKFAEVTSVMDKISLMAAFRYMNLPDTGIDFDQRLIFINNMIDNDAIIQSIDRNKSKFGQEIYLQLKNAADGKGTSLENIRDILEKYKLGPVGMLYLKLFSQMKRNYFTKVAHNALDEIRATPDIGSVYREIMAQTVPARSVATPAPPAAGNGLPLPAPPGRKFALLLGINSYADPAIPHLDSPILDVRDIGKRLGKIGYETEIKENPSKNEIVDALFRLGNKLTPRDKLIVYYAGHGYLFSESKLGYWLPADAKVDSANSWIPNRDILQFLARIRANQIMLISDSCYAGSLISGHEITSLPNTRDESVISKHRGVVVMTSGGDEPVFDNSGAGHSVFASILLKILADDPQSIRSGFNLFSHVSRLVSSSIPQTPVYASLDIAGHDQGMDYYFVESSPGPAPPRPPVRVPTNEEMTKLMWDAALGNNRALDFLTELAKDGNRNAQVAVSRAYLNRPSSDENALRHMAWSRIAARSEIKTDSEQNDDRPTRWISARDQKIQADSDIFVEGFFMRMPNLRDAPAPPVPAAGARLGR